MKGKNDYLKLGDWNAECDRCGFKYKASQLREEWDGFIVCKDCWEPRHEQDFIRGIEDDPSVPWTRPFNSNPTDTTSINGSGIKSPYQSVKYGDADVTYTWSDTLSNILIFDSELTANRTITLAGSPSKNDILQVYKTITTGAGSLDIGGVYTVPANLAQMIKLTYSGAAWQLTSAHNLGL